MSLLAYLSSLRHTVVQQCGDMWMPLLYDVDIILNAMVFTQWDSFMEAERVGLLKSGVQMTAVFYKPGLP